LGETMVYTVALLFGPVVGALAGGVGSSLADLLLGYPIYAPGTLVIKGVEGFVVGYLAKKGEKLSQAAWRQLTIIAALLAGCLLGSIGAHYYSGHVSLTLGTLTLTGYVPVSLWVCLGVVVAVLFTALGLGVDPETGWRAVVILAGGSLMVLGYFLYEAFAIALGPWAALAEVPVNIGQVSVGLAVAIPLVRTLERRLPPGFLARA